MQEKSRSERDWFIIFWGKGQVLGFSQGRECDEL